MAKLEKDQFMYQDLRSRNLLVSIAGLVIFLLIVALVNIANYSSFDLWTTVIPTFLLTVSLWRGLFLQKNG